MNKSPITLDILNSTIEPENTLLVVDMQNMGGAQKECGKINLIKLIKAFNLPKTNVLVCYPDYYNTATSEEAGQYSKSRNTFFLHLKQVATVEVTGVRATYEGIESNNDDDIHIIATREIVSRFGSLKQVKNVILMSGDGGFSKWKKYLQGFKMWVLAPFHMISHKFDQEDIYILDWEIFTEGFKKSEGDYYPSTTQPTEEKPRPKPKPIPA